MTVFESLNNTTDKAVDNAEKYLNTSKEYLRLKVFQQLTSILSLVIKFAVIGGLIGLAIIFFAVAGAVTIGEALNSLPLGYAIVAVIFVLFTIITLALRKKIDKKIIETISAKFFD